MSAFDRDYKPDSRSDWDDFDPSVHVAWLVGVLFGALAVAGFVQLTGGF